MGRWKVRNGKQNNNDSILASIGSVIAPIFTPLGWTKAGEGWKMAVAAIT